MNTPPGQIVCPRTPSTPKHGSNFRSPVGSPHRRKQPSRLKQPQRDDTTASQGTISPPPSSPLQHPSPSPRRSPRNMKRARFAQDEKPRKVAEVESNHEERTATRPTLLNAGGLGLATPAKTPRKRKLPPAESLEITSRSLFSSTKASSSKVGSLAAVVASAAALPPPKTPKTPKPDIFANFKTSTSTRHTRRPSKIEIGDVEEREIEIFTDSDARRPKEVDPFVMRKPTRSSARKKAERKEKFDKLGEHAHRTDGMYYIFRGKKVFRSFDNLPDRAARGGIEGSDDEGLNPADIKPRLLFPEAHAKFEKESSPPPLDDDEPETLLEEDEEEAETDIDEDAPSQSSIIIASPPPNLALKMRRSVSRMTPDSDADEIVPTKKKFPFPSGPSKKSKKRASMSLFDEGEDGGFELKRRSGMGIFSDEEGGPVVKKSKTKGVKRPLDFGLDTPPRSGRKKARHVSFD